MTLDLVIAEMNDLLISKGKDGLPYKVIILKRDRAELVVSMLEQLRDIGHDLDLKS